MFNKKKANEETQKTEVELTATERELERLKEKRAELDPLSKEYKTISDVILLIQDEQIKNKTIEEKTIANENKSEEKKEKRAERHNKVLVALVSGVPALIGCLTIPFVEQMNPPMSKMFPHALSNLLKRK